MSDEKTVKDVQRRLYALELAEHCYNIDTMKAEVERAGRRLELAVESRECFLLRENVPILAKYGTFDK